MARYDPHMTDTMSYTVLQPLTTPKPRVYAKSRVLLSAGYRVIEAGTGEEALRLAREIEPGARAARCEPPTWHRRPPGVPAAPERPHHRVHDDPIGFRRTSPTVGSGSRLGTRRRCLSPRTGRAGRVIGDSQSTPASV